MNLKLRREEFAQNEAAPPVAVSTSAAAKPPTAAAPPSINGWLGVFATMLPRRQAESIREELETHLRERVRDLMVGGLNEAESTKRAIAELGEAAELAGKYRALQTEPRRRIAMYGTIFAVAGAALALSVASITGGRQPEVAKARAETEAVRKLLVDTLVSSQPERDPAVVLDILARAQLAEGAAPITLPRARLDVAMAAVPATFTDQPPAPELENLKIDVNFEGNRAEEVFQLVGKSAGMPVQVNWTQLEQAGLPADARVTLRAKQAGAAVILRAINESAREQKEGAIVDWRARNGVLVVGLRDYFDRQEVKLVIYDLDRIIAARQDKYNEAREKIVEEVVKLVTEFVSPTGWRDNGGDLAKMTVVGDRMFVEAPERFHTQIKWMLEQLPGEKPRKEGNSGGLDMQRYVIQHIAATEALNALKANQAIKAIDFGDFCVDDRTNSVLGKASAEQHAMVTAVLGQIDTEAAAQKEKKRSELPARDGTVYVSGAVARPGVYGAPAGLTLRRLLVAAGGLPTGAVEVIISDSANGQATVSQTVPAQALSSAEGPDPVIKAGQLVSVR